jgi:hypothetical protein
MAEIRILQFQEQGLKINNEVEDYRKKTIQIGVAPIVLYTGEDDTFAVRLQIVYKLADAPQIIMEYAILMVFKTEGWKERLTKYSTDNIKNDQDVKHGIKLALGGARGALALRTVNTKMAGAILPDLPIEDVLLNVTIQKVKET